MELESLLFFATATVSLMLSYFVLDKLRGEDFYDDDVHPLSFSKYGIWRTFHSLISPWAYFKPWKVKEGWSIIFEALLLFILGTILMASLFS